MATPQQQQQQPPATQRNDQPKLIGELKAIGREALKETQSTLQEIFFGKPAGPHEPGTPLTPTQAMVNDDLGKMSFEDLKQYAANKAAEAGKEMGRTSQERGREM